MVVAACPMGAGIGTGSTSTAPEAWEVGPPEGCGVGRVAVAISLLLRRRWSVRSDSSLITLRDRAGMPLPPCSACCAESIRDLPCT